MPLQVERAKAGLPLRAANIMTMPASIMASIAAAFGYRTERIMHRRQLMATATLAGLLAGLVEMAQAQLTAPLTLR